ncbi:Dnaj-like subfamily b member 13 protein [Dioscorea alata]|uniref:Dnaj-like subfamily b member 13 protein n=1 Tax=Dioscorea alata TaxID=55571 RepID=A0ACB7WC38_DIOAL|nr:Dnaj-like subfamily b member 13 protein [Dioscorea alata]
MANPSDFYKVLNLPKDASLQDIRKSYKELVKKWHPDKHPPSSKLEAEARFKAITQAYEALHEQECQSMFGVHNEKPEMRRQYRNEDLPPYVTPRREFKNIYYANMARSPGYSSSFSNSLRRKPPPIERKLECTLEELCHGCRKDIKFTRDVVTKAGLIVKKQESQTIKVKPGWKKGTKITFEGMGDERPGCLPADVIYMIAEKEHQCFKRVGNDLVLKVEVPLVNALTGWTFSFRLIGGEKMSCTFNDEIIYPGYEKVITGQGMPLANDKGMRGDLRIKFCIIFPGNLTDEQRSDIVQVLKDTT